MKKRVSLLLVACILITSLFTLTSCLHFKCEFSDEWSCDDSYHWHACTNEKCDKVSDKSAHSWGEGEITVKATQEADGVRTKTCSVCNTQKEETVVFTGLDWTEWNMVFSKENFANFTYHERALANYEGIQISTVAVYKFTETKVQVSLTVAGSTKTETASGLQAVATRDAMIKSIQDMLQYGEFEYDKENKVYNLTGRMWIENIGEAKSAKLKFENGMPKELVYTCTVYSNGIPMDCESTITFTDFGTTKVN
jgi:hypothetical protein